MPYRQHGKQCVSRFYLQVFVKYAVYLEDEALVVQHYPFWYTGCTRCVYYGRKVCNLPFCQFPLESLGIRCKNLPTFLQDVVKADNFYSIACKLFKLIVCDWIEYDYALKER